MPKVRKQRKWCKIANGLLSLEDEQIMNTEVYGETGICLHPVKDLRYTTNGTITCANCLNRVYRSTFHDERLDKEREGVLRSAVYRMFIDGGRLLFGWETAYKIVNHCMAQWEKIRLTMGWTARTGCNLTNKSHFVAYAMYKVCHAEEIYRLPADVARVFFTSEAKLLLAEDTYCLESGSRKLFTSTRNLLETISRWMYMEYNIKIFVEKLVDRIERPLYGKTPETILMVAFRLAKKYLDEKQSQSIDIKRAAEVLDVPLACGENSIAFNYEYAVIDYLRDILPNNMYANLTFKMKRLHDYIGKIKTLR